MKLTLSEMKSFFSPRPKLGFALLEESLSQMDPKWEERFQKMNRKLGLTPQTIGKDYIPTLFSTTQSIISK